DDGAAGPPVARTSAPPPPPPPPPPADPWDHDPGSTGFGASLSRVSLRTRMVVLIVVALVLGLTFSTVAATTLLRGYLVDQLDRQLLVTASAAQSGERDIAALTASSALPSEYYFEVQSADGRRTHVIYDRRSTAAWGAPVIP